MHEPIANGSLRNRVTMVQEKPCSTISVMQYSTNSPAENGIPLQEKAKHTLIVGYAQFKLSKYTNIYLKVAMSQSATWDGVNKKHRHYVLNFLVSLASRTVATRRPRRLAGHRCVRCKDRFASTSRNLMAVLTACGSPAGPKRLGNIRIKGAGSSTFYNALLPTL
ncbi:hypothetical protein IWW34DRAFT_795982 [Fusarium oxysporum f. sp. albedinis]|nr:hypothetical protein IWW34DRAFT_795982 [Fusarium oxysporum f. sp. albedinis]